MSGWTDVPLSSAGRQQVAALKNRFLSEPPVDAIYSSPLIRARETASGIAYLSESPLRLADDLREINCGRADGLPLSEVKRTYRTLWEQNLRQDDEDFRWPGGESCREFRTRVIAGIDRIAAAHPMQRILIVTHAGVISQILGVVYGLSPARWERFRPENASVTEVRWANLSPEIISFNDHRHLEAMELAATESG